MSGSARRFLTVIRLARMARGAGFAVMLALVVAAPAAAAEPTRTVNHITDLVQHFAAGDGCPFDVTVQKTPGARVTITDFSDGREVVEAHSMHRTITSDTTGLSFVENIESRDVEWIDPTTGLVFGQTSGQFIDTFWPGDAGPYGIVDQNVSYSIVGHQTYVLDPNTYGTLAVTIKGTITDICAALS